MTIRDVSSLTGVHMRTVHRRRADMITRGEKVGRWNAPRPNNFTCAEVKGADIVRQLLLEGHQPSLLRDIMKIPPDVILTIRAELLRRKTEMKITDENIELVFKGFQTVYNESFDGTASHKDTLAMTVTSHTTAEQYGWFGQFAQLREWVGDRHVKQLSSHGFAIRNRKF